jgi:hypothetical protein
MAGDPGSVGKANYRKQHITLRLGGQYSAPRGGTKRPLMNAFSVFSFEQHWSNVCGDDTSRTSPVCTNGSGSTPGGASAGD